MGAARILGNRLGFMLEPRFDRVDKQRRAHTGRLIFVIGCIVGPSLGLAAFGFYDAAASALFICIGLALGLVWIYDRASVIEGADLNVFVAAGIVVAFGLVYGALTNWLRSWLFD